jgi:hypothetical protein
MGWIQTKSQSALLLADKKLKELSNMQKDQTKTHHTITSNRVAWIEKLLQTPIDDYRKTAVSLILAPYQYKKINL